MIIKEFNFKEIRSHIIKKYLEHINCNKVVCFSCGNASRELKKVGLDVVDISPTGDFLANKWFKSNEIFNLFKDRFNATSGYLPFDLMYDIGLEYRNILGELKSPVTVPSGSGETLVCLKMAYPDIDFIATFDNNYPATTLDEKTPLFPVVTLLAKTIIIKSKD